MFNFDPSAKYYARLAPTDLRLSYDGLYALVEDEMKINPLHRGVFLFTNRQKTRIKILHWDNSGLWICQKRFETGLLYWPKIGGELDVAQFQQLIQGLDFSHQPQWKPRRRAAA